jgi:uncharacterized protein YjbI with pentapeptide repeats
MPAYSRIKVSIGCVAAAWLLSAVAPPAMACDHPRGWKPSIDELKREAAARIVAFAPVEHGKQADTGPDQPFPIACNGDLRNADLSKLELVEADFKNADLRGANLADGNFGMSSFDGANLSGAKATNSSFASSSMLGANLDGAHLDNAFLLQTDLTGAHLRWTDLTGATLEGANLTGANYEPRGGQPARISGLIGLETVTFRDATGVAQLRQLARETGQRDIVRAATYAIERERTAKMRGNRLNDWIGSRPYVPMLEGLFRRVAFEWTTGYGLYPGRALNLILLFLVLFAPLYAWAAWRVRPRHARAGLYRVLPADRIELANGQPQGDNPLTVERLVFPARQAIAWGSYFSLLSAFNIGFRDFNVGSWIIRIQPSRFHLESLGWVRTVSGLQSLLTLYLLAMWLLTFFGHPFD